MDDDAHNPPLPEELAELYPDLLGDTMLSQTWVLDSLMRTLQAVEDEPKDVEIVELQSDIEERLSLIWDLSADHDVAEFLHAHNFSDLSFSMVEKTNSPRLVELCLGILANLAAVLDDPGLTDTHLSVLPRLAGSSDAPIATQALRLMETKLTAVLPHLDADFRASIAFILSSSTNKELVLQTLRFLIKLLTEHDDLVDLWGEELVEGLLTEVPKTLEEDRTAFQDILYLSHLFSTESVALWKHRSQFLDMAETYIERHLEDETLPADLRTLATLLSTLPSVLSPPDIDPRIPAWVARFSGYLKLLEPDSNEEHQWFTESLHALITCLDAK